MLDIKWIRENSEALDKALASRDGQPCEGQSCRVNPVSSQLLALDEKRRSIISELQELQNRRNILSKEIGQAKSKGEDAADLFAEMQTVGPKVKELEEQQRNASADLDGLLATIPNVPDSDVPYGKDDNDNVELRQWGEIPSFDFEPKPHYELGENLGMLDFEVAGKISGSRFAWLQGDLARLERALGAFMLDVHTQEHGFIEVYPPLLINPESMFNTGQYPKFEEDAFITNDERELVLAPTSEVSMTNYVRGEMLKESDLPMRFTAFSPNFRKEAGSAGKDTRGYIRMHQFNKVEMVQIVHPKKSDEALEFMLTCAEKVMQRLGLAYRIMTLCTGDIGFAAKKTYDFEVWLPAQNTYREISSCSNCGDFQARRMKSRFKDKDGNVNFVHTLNGTGVATGRALVAVLENYQQADGSIVVPEVLRPYMGGMSVISG